MSEMFGSKYKPAREFAPLLNKGGEAGFSMYKDTPTAPAPLAAPLQQPKPLIEPLVQPSDSLGKAARKPTILSAGQSASPISATYSGSKLG